MTTLSPPEIITQTTDGITIKLGSPHLRTPSDFRLGFAEKQINISKQAGEVLDDYAFSIAPEEIELDIMPVNIGILGFNGGATVEDIYLRANERLGLDICPAEVGPQALLQDIIPIFLAFCHLKPSYGWVVAMDLIAGRIFGIRQETTGLWLNAYKNCPGLIWGPKEWFIFCSNQKTLNAVA